MLVTELKPFFSDHEKESDYNIIMLFFVMSAQDGEVFKFYYEQHDAVAYSKSIDNSTSIGYFKCWCINRNEDFEPTFPSDIRHHQLIKMIENSINSDDCSDIEID